MHAGQVVGATTIALGDGRTGIAGASALPGVAWEGQSEADILQQLPSPSRSRMANIEAGMGCDGHLDIGHPDCTRLVSVGIERGNEGRIGWSRWPDRERAYTPVRQRSKLERSDTW